MRALGIAVAIALTLTAGTAWADDPTAPSKRDVREARSAADDKARDVAAVQADLVVANQRLQASAIQAAQAAEAWNGARWRLQQAQRAARVAEQRAGLAQADVERQREAYGDALATSYQLSPGLTAMSAIAQSDGITTVIDRATTMQNAEEALDSHYDAFRAASTLAEVAKEQAEQAREEAATLEAEAREARDAARSAADAAAAEAQAIAEQKDALIAELARLQNISKQLAEERQAALEAAAAQAAAEAAQQEQEQEQQEQEQQDPTPDPQPGPDSDPNPDPSPDPQPDPQPEPSPDPQPEPSPDPQPEPSPNPPPAPQPDPAPAPSGGAGAAIAFARDQLGEPYQWGAAGPGAWDCSGLTMGAWRAGGKYLPHYSVAQYDQSTAISPSQLQRGDLVFWGSSSSPSSIYHVALYIGGGQIIHAPRTGRPVSQESMYYWTTPNFYARP